MQQQQQEGYGGYYYGGQVQGQQQQQQQPAQQPAVTADPNAGYYYGGNAYYNQPQQQQGAVDYGTAAAQQPNEVYDANAAYSAYATSGGVVPASSAGYQGESAAAGGMSYGSAGQYAQQQQQQLPQTAQPQLAASGYAPQSSMMASTDGGSSGAPPAMNAVDANGLRWSWSTYPNTAKTKAKEHATVASIPLPEMIVPMSCMYTPLLPITEANILHGDPAAQGQQCPTCGAYWNVHSFREEGKFWVCLSCLRRNPLPSNYTPQHPALLYETVEYILPAGRSTLGLNSSAPIGANPTLIAQQQQEEMDLRHPVFIFVVDVCLPADEMDALKANLLRSLEWLPRRSLIGLVTFSARTSVWELSSFGMSKCFVLRGEEAYDPAELGQMLQVSDATPARGRFLVPLEECEETLRKLIDEMQSDTGAQPSNKRPLRTTGTAVEVATFLMEALYCRSPGRTPLLMGSLGGSSNPSGGGAGGLTKVGKVLLFTGGPCTRGPGTVVGTDKAEMMRFHRDIIEGETPFYNDAFNFYSDLATRLSAVNACLDIFAQSFDQTGVMEMRHCVNNTGGALICGDAFNHEIFSTSYERYFDRCDLRNKDFTATLNGGADTAPYPVRCAFGVHMEVYTSADTLVSGVLGPCNEDPLAAAASGGKTHRAASPVQIGVGGTTRWCVSTMDQSITFAFIFDTATQEGNSAASSNETVGHQNRRFVQFVTRYTTSTGEHRVRVTSTVQPLPPPNASPSYYAQGQTFDQTCASTIIARMAVSILERFPNKWDDAKRWLDTLLVRFVRRYASYTPGRPESLRLEPCLSLFPSFMYNLRRSEYFAVLNISPDETTFKRHWLMREPVDNCVLMIQPTLDSYDLEHPYATAVLLDSSSLRHDNIVLMDAFFNVHIMWGSTIFEWIKAKYQESPDYAYFAELLEKAEADAQAILAQRYPYPRFSRTDADGSEARHVKTRVNPATSYQNLNDRLAGGGAAQGTDLSDMIYTDDASITKFMASLKQAVMMESK